MTRWMMAVLAVWSVAAAGCASFASETYSIGRPGDPNYDIRLPKLAAFRGVYPPKAADLGIEGRTMLRCQMRKNGRPSACVAEWESPAGYGFGDAAVTLLMTSRDFRVVPVKGRAMPPEVRIPLRFALS